MNRKRVSEFIEDTSIEFAMDCDCVCLWTKKGLATFTTEEQLAYNKGANDLKEFLLRRLKK